MKLKPAILIQGLSTVAISLFLACCEAAPTEPVEDLVVAAGKPIRPPKDVGAEFELYSYSVAVETGQARGFTDNPEVDQELSTHLNTELPPSAYDHPTFDDWQDYLGCPTAEEPCSAVTLVMNRGNVLAFSASAVPVVNECGGSGSICLLDEDLGNRRKATVHGATSFPSLPWGILEKAFTTDPETGHTTFTFYWQGQRVMSARLDTGLTEKVKREQVPIMETVYHWDRFPDLHPAGTPERFLFHPYFQVGQRTIYHPTISADNLFKICGSSPACLGEFQGAPGVDGLTVGMEGSWIADGVAEIKVTAEANSVTNPNPESFARVMMTTSSGGREMLDYEWQARTSISRDKESGEAATWFRVEGLDPNACHRFDLVGLMVVESEFDTFWEDNRLVWNGSKSQVLLGDCPST